MNDKIREVALQVAREMSTFCRTEYDEYTHECYEFSEAELPDFLTRCLAELSITEQDKLDAARLDWLLKNNDAVIINDGAYGPYHVWFRYSNRVTEKCKTGREAIDRAMEYWK
jgi:hypothetical protein